MRVGHRRTVAAALTVAMVVLPAGCGGGGDGDGDGGDRTTAKPAWPITGGLARTPKRYRVRLIGPSVILGPRATGLKGTDWEVIIRTDRKLPLRTPGDRKRYRLRLRDHQGRILESASLQRFTTSPAGVWCYDSGLNARAPSLLHALNIGDTVQISLELLVEYPSPVGTRIARPETRTVRAGYDTRVADRAMAPLRC